MALRVVTISDEETAPARLREELRRAVDSFGSAVLLVPSFEYGSRVQKELADHGGPAVGVTVSTPTVWASDVWRLWGDGREPVDAVTRRLLVRRAVEYVPEGLREGLWENPGTIDTLGRMAARALPWLPLTEDGEPDDEAALAAGLSAAETAALRVVGAYRALLREKGLMERSEVMAEAPRALAASGSAAAPVFACGFSSLRRAERELLCGLADAGEVTVLAFAPEGPAGDECSRARDRLVADAEGRGIACEAELDRRSGESGRAGELERLLGRLFRSGEDVASEGAVELLHPAGPAAEWEIVAQRAAELAGSGARSIVVSAADARAAWRGLAPKFAARGMSVRARLTEPISELPAGRVFFGYLHQVAQLKALSESWPARVPCEEGEAVRLGDMSWWPPKALIDFLMHDMAGLPEGRAWEIDRAWRGNRLLTPQDVLAQLMDAKKTSPVVARATAELMLGRIGSCASKLLGPYRDDSDSRAALSGAAATELERQEAAGVLRAAMMVAGALGQLGYTAAPLADGAISLGELVERAVSELSCISLVVTPALTCEDAACEVLIADASYVAGLPAASADAVFACGLTATESAVGRSDDALSEVLEALGVEPRDDKLACARRSFHRTVSVARRNLVAERCVNDADANETFPSVMLCELYGAYGIPGSTKPHKIFGLPTSGRPEGLLAENLLAQAAAPSASTFDQPSATGALPASARPFILVPNNGQKELAGGLPSLSASQIESYLECPYKWFSLRRLRLEGIDAGFGAVEQGTFVHRVLELSHLRLIEEALCEADMAGEVPDLTLHPEARVSGSRVTAANVERAKRIVEEEFDNHLRHQMLARKRVSRNEQLLVPHFAADREEISRMKADLLSTMDYQAGILLGYEPRFLEWGFGGPHDEPVGYAGVWLNGKIDRMDVDAAGRALIVDYKHRSPSRFADYDAFRGDFDPDVLPRHVQSLIYAQVVRRMHPEIQLVGALFLCTKGNHALAGACVESQVDRVLGCVDRPAPESRRASMGISGPGGGTQEFWDYLDHIEAMVAEKIADLLEGKIEADPIDADACSYCPVLHCEKRMGAR
ncbi:PD-(D/E)XK nuclease family protein [Paratractidigestivibacter sp.]|uniref:PD-(D/E)XK nuclease family protein n=1 Tax=Paratractidigestivibacter sp. TaxID=2847316 RepID=UPI002AC93C18|nr:PD-(D/E)XK nuclease family protein [Paratractidigestivibacter sp.]